MRLLVSVINSEEAEEAVKGGAEILDLKDPREGSLGAAHPRFVADVCRQYSHILPISAAIGDFPHMPNSAALAAFCAATLGVEYIKVGLLGSHSEWQAADLLAATLDALDLHHSKAKLIAAVYADYPVAGTLAPRLLPAVARRANVAGCMIDTLNKNGTCLFDYLDIDRLREFICECGRYGLLSALAGSLQPHHASVLSALGPDVVGVRGAVCEAGVRVGKIDRQKVVEFRSKLSGASSNDQKGASGCAPTA